MKKPKGFMKGWEFRKTRFGIVARTKKGSFKNWAYWGPTLKAQ